MTTAYLLVSHGSSDPRHRKSLMRLAQLVRQQLENPPQSQPPQSAQSPHHEAPVTEPIADNFPVDRRFPPGRLASTDEARRFGPAPPLVGVAMLEATTLSLAQQIATFGHRAAALGVTQVVIAPLFLLQGVHVVEDLPREIATAQQQLGKAVQLQCTVHLGGYDGLQTFLTQRLSAATPAVLVAHGSRQADGNRRIEKLAKRMGATAAFWAVAPNLETRLIELIQQGHQQLTVLPLFLFPGTITDAIMRQVDALAERFPRLRLRLLPPLGSSEVLAAVIVALLMAAGSPQWMADVPEPRLSSVDEIHV